MTAKESPAIALPPKPAALAPRTPRVLVPLVLVIAYWTGWVVSNVAFSGQFLQFMFLFWSPLALAIVVVLWWLLLSRMTWLNRLWAVGALVAGFGLATALGHRTMAEPPVPMGILMYALPVGLTAMTVYLVVTRGAASWLARLGLLAVALLAFGYFTLIRIDGIYGTFAVDRSWRWTTTSEQFYLQELSVTPVAARAKGDSAAREPLPPVAAATDWPEFRGAARDGVVRGVKFAADCKAHPPQELWRRRVGPGWSSFATVGNVAFTQEQRGPEEAVVCFDITTGDEIWAHVSEARFWEVVAGAGPRATPTFAGGRLYTQGGSGRVHCLDPASGRIHWMHDLAFDFGVKPPMWGFSASPLVTHGVAIVYAGADDNKGLVAYSIEHSAIMWTAGKAKHSYSSPQLATIDGVPQVLFVSDHGLEAFEPGTGKPLWDHPWPLEGMFRVCQPHVMDGGRVLLSTPMMAGTRLVQVSRTAGAWKVEEKWTAAELKPYFNDFVRHEGFLYGFDGQIFSCLDAATGKRKWQKGRYGHGQVLLAADQGLLIVLSEQGELVLLEASPTKLIERGRFQALTGKTWNHPVITGNKLLVRNDTEMACYELPPPR
jgi:outer membrane protein assembly factor BamB